MADVRRNSCCLSQEQLLHATNPDGSRTYPSVTSLISACPRCAVAGQPDIFVDQHPPAPATDSPGFELLQQQLRVAQEQLRTTTICLNFLRAQQFDPWEQLSHSSLPATAARHMTQPVVQYYGLQPLECQLLGVLHEPDNQTGSVVQCVPIWPAHTHGQFLEHHGLQARDVDNERNFLRLHHDIVCAFNQRILFRRDNQKRIVLHVLDPALLAPSKVIGTTGVTFAQLHGQRALHFPNSQRPFQRLLAAHAQKATQKAQKNGWIGRPQLSAEEVHAQEIARHTFGGGAERTARWMEAQRQRRAAEERSEAMEAEADPCPGSQAAAAASLSSSSRLPVPVAASESSVAHAQLPEQEAPPPPSRRRGGRGRGRGGRRK